MSAYIPVELQRRIRERFFNGCAYCRTAESLTGMTFEFEHIMPRSLGGETLFENLCFACPNCNRHKADRQMAVDQVTEQSVSLFHPQLQIWGEYFAWSDNGQKLVGLSPIGRATIAALRMNRSQLVWARGLWVKLGEHPPKWDG
ncbi:MAG: HNH endonuclease [Nostocaceae cyanobacterium]|nr:HNH endonuclease [Nostocaceae cyanobacterium]